MPVTTEVVPGIPDYWLPIEGTAIDWRDVFVLTFQIMSDSFEWDSNLFLLLLVFLVDLVAEKFIILVRTRQLNGGFIL